MVRRAIVDESGKVLNVVEVAPGSKWTPPAGTTSVIAAEGAEPDGTFDGRDFTRKSAPPARDPDEAPLTPAELKAVRQLLAAQ